MAENKYDPIAAERGQIGATGITEGDLDRLSPTSSGFIDPSGSYPKPEYVNDAGVNKASRGKSYHHLEGGAGYDNIQADVSGAVETQYPHNDVRETKSGHVLEFNDTPGGERILIKHRTGSGIDIRPDGTIIVSTKGNMTTTVAGNNTLIVDGEVNLQVSGNLNLKVSGDLTFDVGGNIVTNVGGSQNSTVNGSSREMVYGNSGSIVAGSRSVTTAGTETNSALGGKNNITKGDYRQSVDGNMTSASSGKAKFSSQGKMNISAPNMNMASESLSVFGATGTIGGEGIFMYANNMFANSGSFNEGVEAPSFHGNLVGKAKFAALADKATGATTAGSLGSSGTASYPSETAVNTAASAQPTAENVQKYLSDAQGGTEKVVVDEGDFIKNAIDQSVNNGGVSNRLLNTREVRSRMRDPANRNNTQFVDTQLANGTLSPNYSRPVAPGIGRVASSSPSVRTPNRSVNSVGSRGGSRYRPNKDLTASTFVPNPNYDVNKLTPETPIDASVMLERGIPLGKFLGGTGEKTTLDWISSRGEKLEIARQLSMHAAAMKTVMSDRAEFMKHRLVVVEGLYHPGSGENTTPDGLKDLASRGRVVVYELHNASGKVDADKTYDLALYWKDSLLYDKLILDYDHYDPSGELNVQLILVMPQVDYRWELVDGKYDNEVATYYNNNVQSSSELIELIDDGRGGVKVAEQPHKVDTNQINPDLVKILEQSGNELGIKVVTTSGYRSPSSNPSGRHAGDASDVALYYEGRRLSVGNVEDRALIERYSATFADKARSMGYTPSIGAANHTYSSSRWYMSGNTFHYDIAVGHSIPADRGTYWGGSGSTEDVPAPDWLKSLLG